MSDTPPTVHLSSKHGVTIVRGERISIRRLVIDKRDPRKVVPGDAGVTILRSEFAWHLPTLEALIAELTLMREELRNRGPR